MRTLSSPIILFSLASALLSAVVHAAPSAKYTSPTSTTTTMMPGTYNINGNVNVDVPPKYGRSATEYFLTPIVGVNYVDITQISPSFLKSDTHIIPDNNISANSTELGGVFGLLFDAQYQITATDYWRGGFQTGVLYTSPAETGFEAHTCVGTPPNNCSPGGPQVLQEGTLETSSIQVPLMFTVSRYAANDQYIMTFGVGPVLTYQMYDLDFEPFDLKPESEEQILFEATIDARFKLGASDNFFLIGFDAIPSFGGGGNNGFSGVETLGSFLVYAGLSFS